MSLMPEQIETATPKIQLAIMFDPTTGALSVNGPIDNLILCFGLLEMAKENLRNHHAKNQARIALVPPGMRLPQP